MRDRMFMVVCGAGACAALLVMLGSMLMEPRCAGQPPGPAIGHHVKIGGC